MALVYSSNQQPTTSADAFYRLITLLVSAGWTVAAAGDGLSAYSPSSGTAVTSAGSGANGFNNNNAWIFIKMPGSNRGFVFQVITAASNTITIRYFGPSTAVTNTPSATTAPVSTTPNAASQDVASNVAYVGTLNRVHYWADNTAPYGFGIHGWNTSGIPTFNFVLDGLQTGTYHPSNQDPYIISDIPATISPNPGWSFGGPGSNTVCARENSILKCWTRYNLSSSSFRTSAICIPSHAVVFNRGEINWYSVWGQVTIGQSVSIFDNKDEEIAATYYYVEPNFSWNSSANGGASYYNNTILGVSSYVRIYRQYRSSNYYLNTLSVNSVSDRIVLGNSTLPWSGVTPVIS